MAWNTAIHIKLTNNAHKKNILYKENNVNHNIANIDKKTLEYSFMGQSLSWKVSGFYI
jgi:hypothetical protein